MTRIDEIEGIKIIRISGDFNMETTPDLQKLCNRVTFDKNTKAVLIDFQMVANADSAPFACMINFMKEHVSQEIKIGIINLKEKDKDLIQILKLGKAIQTYKSEREAIKKLKS